MKTTTKRHKTTSALPRLTEIEIPTAEAWLASGAITETIRGEENTYYIDGFYREFFCKNYPERPTDTGAARMVAKQLQDRGYSAKPSDISICRIEECCYQTR